MEDSTKNSMKQTKFRTGLGRGIGYIFFLLGFLFSLESIYNIVNNISPKIPYLIFLSVSLAVFGITLMYGYRRSVEHFVFHIVWIGSLSVSLFLTNINFLLVYEIYGVKMHPTIFVFIFWWLIDKAIGKKLE